MKAKLLCIISAVFTLLFATGCGSRPHCTMTVVTSYGGSDMEGNNLGSGTFTESFTVSGGDIFYEEFGGEWTTDKTDMSEKDIIAVIDKVEADGVTVKYGEETVKLPYITEKKLQSNFIVCDGINYDYRITFSSYTEK